MLSDSSMSYDCKLTAIFDDVSDTTTQKIVMKNGLLYKTITTAGVETTTCVSTAARNSSTILSTSTV